MLTFLHGFLGVQEDWNEVAKELDAPMRFLTLPGHKDKSLNFEEFEDEIGSGVTLVGYSMGGRIAMHYALKYPNRVSKLILLSANPGESGEERLAKDESWAQLLETDGIDLFLKKWYAQPLFKTLKIDRSKQGHHAENLAKILRKVSPARLPNLWNRLDEFSCPVMFLFGENDIKYQSIGTKLQDNFEVKWIPKSGHAVHIENPKACSKYIMEAL